MTTHVVCLDGTNQVKTQIDPTNVARIFDALGGGAGEAGNGSWETTNRAVDLKGKYLPGVGAQGNPVLKILGNAFGDGIAEPIVRGYTFLSRNYRPGDQIVVTGFSRGATAARALAGLVVTHGLLNPDPGKYDVNNKNQAYMRAVAAWYASRSDRRDLANQARLALIGLTLGQAVPPLDLPDDYVQTPQLLAVGVFDTVSSLGVPHLDAHGDAVFDFTICNTTLNPKILNGFHAIAADETRDLFAPTYWADRPGVVQQIFPGVHSNVGGGYPERGLSDGALKWMLDQLIGVGVPADANRLDPAPNPSAIDIARDDAITPPFNATPCRPRNFPHTATAHQSIKDRWDKITEVFPSMRPTPYKATGTYTDGTPIYP